MSTEQKTFRDLLGRDIKIGDNVLHLWTKIGVNRYVQGREGAVNSKLATVIKQTPKGIGIEWRDKRDKRKIKRSTVFNTRNRLIVLDGKNLIINYDDIVNDVKKEYESYKKGLATSRKNLRTKLKLKKEELKLQFKINDELFNKNEELKEVISQLTKDSERFNLLNI